MMELQRTLKTELSLTGIGLHSGKMINLCLKPAAPGRGIRFVRTDLPGTPEIPALYKNVVCTQLATTLGLGNARVSTVEHLMAAFQGLGVDNALVEVDGPEVPIMDGSSEIFSQAILKAGTVAQLQPRACLVVRRKLELKLAEKWATIEPASGFEIQGSIEWDHPSVGYQEFFYRQNETAFQELSSARTFGFLKDVEALKKMGLARGGSLENAVVLDDALVLNPEGLRFPNEFVRHKILDALGDFKLAGLQIHARIRLHRAGHDLHVQLLNEVFKNPEYFEIVDRFEAEDRIFSLYPTLIREVIAI